MTDFGGMLTFQLKGGLGAAITLAQKIRVFQYATSLGHAHSLLFLLPHRHVCRRGHLPGRRPEGAHRGVDACRYRVRVSIGLEDADDLIADLDQALRGRSFQGLVGPLAYRLLKSRG